MRKNYFFKSPTALFILGSLLATTISVEAKQMSTGLLKTTPAFAVGDSFTVNGINYQVTLESATANEVIVRENLTNFYTGAIVIPATVTNSATNISYTVTAIGDAAFFGRAITSISIPNTVRTIGESAFFTCNSLATVNIPNSITSIGKSAFYSCNAIQSLTIPKSVQSIGTLAFYGCQSLVNIYTDNPTPLDLTNSANVFFGVPEYPCTLHVPTGSKAAYQAANQWRDFLIVDDVLAANETKTKNISIYPNPAKDFIRIDNLKNISQISIYDVNGRLVGKEKAVNNQINVSKYPVGSYILNILADGETYSSKVIKK